MFAFDRSSRAFDADGRLHVRVSNMSKATVNPYRGNEIPNFEGLGLDPDRVYYLLRDPAELAASASTFNNLPILSKHVPVTVDAPSQELVVGSTGTDAVFSEPYLQNSLVIWVASAIAGIQTREQQELSAAYRYVADMTPGTYKGLRYDGVMRDIRGNHVALVTNGRAGSDVVVGDSQPEGFSMLKTRAALMLSGALAALVTPRLASGMAFDSAPLLAGVSHKNFARSTKDLAARVVELVSPKLAADEGLDIADVVQVIAAVQGMPMEDEPAVAVDDTDPMSRVMAFLSGKLDDADMAQIKAMCTGEPVPAMDVDPKEDKEKDPPAMDAKTIEANAMGRMRSFLQAQADVRPYIGELPDLIGMDSAASIYRLALDAAKVDLTGVDESAYPAILKLVPKPGGVVAPKRPAVAMDADAQADFRKRYPGAHTLKQAF